MNFLSDPTTFFAAAAVAAAAFFLLRGPRVAPWIIVRALIALLCLFSGFVLYAGALTPEFVRLGAIAAVSLTFLFAALDVLTEAFLRIKCAVVNKFFTKTLPAHMLEICGAVEALAVAKTGALIVIEKRDSLAEAAEGGVPFDADVKSEILRAIFATSSPVHDGAVIVTGGRISRVKTVLPLRTGTAMPMGVGTRHRAAMGITERTDAIAVVVSEERGEISVGYRGSLSKPSSRQELEKMLLSVLKAK